MKKILYFALAVMLLSCSGTKKEKLPLLDAKKFEKEYQGKKISLYTLESGNGLTMQVTNFGIRVVSLFMADKNGKYDDIVLGHPNIDEYINYKGERCLGSIVGRFGNRIAKGTFELDSVRYHFPLNNNGQTLHGGFNGFDMKVWNVDSISSNEIHFSYISPDGEEGFPGTLKVKVVYTLTPENEFKITYEATTDKPTHVNLTHHTFFNLKGTGNGTILDNQLMIKASNYTPVDSVLIPFGKIEPVEGTPFDFRNPTEVGKRINEKNIQLKNGQGYDHNWVIDRTSKNDIELVARLYEPKSGRFIEVYSDQPGLQMYSGNFLDGKVIGKYGKAHKFREAIALETQKFPDTPNQPSFPSTRLNPGEVYHQTCIYKFSVK